MLFGAKQNKTTETTNNNNNKSAAEFSRNSTTFPSYINLLH